MAGHLGCVPVALESAVFNRQIDYMILTILLWIDRCPASADRLLHTSSSMRAMTTELWGRCVNSKRSGKRTASIPQGIQTVLSLPMTGPIGFTDPSPGSMTPVTPAPAGLSTRRAFQTARTVKHPSEGPTWLDQSKLTFCNSHRSPPASQDVNTPLRRAMVVSSV